MSKTDAVDYLIQAVKDSAKGSATQTVAIEALGEAGGNQAIDYLMEFATDASRGSNALLAALRALGRASRNVE